MPTIGDIMPKAPEIVREVSLYGRPSYWPRPESVAPHCSLCGVEWKLSKPGEWVGDDQMISRWTFTPLCQCWKKGLWES